jgi:hypothetical protein
MKASSRNEGQSSRGGALAAALTPETFALSRRSTQVSRNTPAQPPADLSYPDGLSGANAENGRRGFGHASPAAIVILGLILLVSLTGALGGGRPADRQVETPAGVITVNSPRVLRNGVFFETTVRFDARQDLQRAVLAFPSALFENVTINTMIPGAEESFEDGEFRLDFGPLPAGQSLFFKLDGQVNPSPTRIKRGYFSVYDGDIRLGALPVDIWVLP